MRASSPDAIVEGVTTVVAAVTLRFRARVRAMSSLAEACHMSASTVTRESRMQGEFVGGRESVESV